MTNKTANSRNERGTAGRKFGFHLKNAFIFIGFFILNQLLLQAPTLPFFIGKKTGMASQLSLGLSIIALLLFIWLFYGIGKGLKVINLKRVFTKKNLLLMIGGAALLQAVGYVSLFIQGGQTNRAEFYASTIEGSSPVSLFIFFTMAAPIAEEVIYRGFIQGYWFKESPKIGIVVSVLTFTMVHFPNNPIVFAQYLISSIIFCLVYQKTKRLEVTIGMHLLNNAPAGLEMLFRLFL